MSRPSADVRAELDALDHDRFALGQEIEEKRKALAALNAKVPDLEREYQAALAREQQQQSSS